MVKRVMATLVISIFVSFTALAQYEKGDWELGFTAEAKQVDKRRDTSIDVDSYFGLHLSAGYFLANGFSLEPELFFFNASDNGTPYKFIIGNLSYTLKLKELKVAPFMKVGAGRGNTTGWRYIDLRQFNYNEWILNASVGMKHMLSSNVAIKYEINHRKYTDRYFNDRAPEYSYTYKISDTSLLVGLTLLLDKKKK